MAHDPFRKPKSVSGVMRWVREHRKRRKPRQASGRAAFAGRLLNLDQ
ncbi:MAG: hypothetical protein E5W53_27415, partial [Mesorhizobium sp.]